MRESVRPTQAPGMRRRGCGRWSTARARSGSARRSGGRAASPAASRRPRAGGRGSRARPARMGRRGPGSRIRLRWGRPTQATPIARRRAPRPRPPRAVRRRPPRDRSPTSASAATSTPVSASPAPTVLTTSAGTPGNVGVERSPQDRAVRSERDHHEGRAGRDQRQRRASAVRLAGHQLRLGGGRADQQRPGHARVRAAAASAGERQRCSRRFGSKISGLRARARAPAPASSPRAPRRRRACSS